MATSNSIQRREVPEKGEGNLGQQHLPELSDEEREAAAWVDELAGAFERSKQCAIAFGVGEPYLSHQRSGAKPTNFVHLARAKKEKPEAFRHLVRVLAIAAGMRVEEDPEVDPAVVDREYREWVESSEQLRRPARSDIAQKLGVSVAAIVRALQSKR